MLKYSFRCLLVSTQKTPAMGSSEDSTMREYEDSRFPSVGEDVIAFISGAPREGRVAARYTDGPFVLFKVLDFKGEIHSDLLPHAVCRKKRSAMAS